MQILKIPLLLLAFTPLVVYSKTLFPFIFPKTVFIRLLLTFFWIGISVIFLFYPKLFKKNIKINFKNPIAVSIAAFLLILIVSTLFAENKYRAFWGDVERGEGLIGILFFAGFFFASWILFSSKEWNYFFIGTLISTFVLFIDQIHGATKGASLFSNIVTGNPTFLGGSLIGNTTFLAGFYIFSIFSALILLFQRSYPLKKSEIFPELLKRAFLYFSAAVAILGIFVSTTRGAIVGIAAGMLAVILFLIFARFENVSNKEDLGFLAKYGKVFAGFFLFCFITFSMFFIFTRHSAVWQKFPGIRDLAQLNRYDPTMQTRLISIGISLRSVSPQNESILRLLFGWGLENFAVAYQKYYDPRYYIYEALWFDRAHNKILDMLVMSGIFGLFAYLSIWYFVFRDIFKKYIFDKEKKHSALDFLTSIAIIFFGVSYFVQNIFAFDNISMYIPFFAFLAFCAHKKDEEDSEKLKQDAIQDRAKNIFGWFATSLALFYLAIFFVTYVALKQMITYFNALETGSGAVLYKNLSKVTTPYTYVQAELRSSFLQLLLSNLKNQKDVEMAKEFLKSLRKAAEESALRERTNARHFLIVASAYEITGELEQALYNEKKALEIAPNRQDVLFGTALTYAKIGDKENAQTLAKKLLDLEPRAARSKIYYSYIMSLLKGEEVFEETTNMVLSIFDSVPKFVPIDRELYIARNLFKFYEVMFYNMKDEKRFIETLRKEKAFEEKYESASGIPPSGSLEVQKGISAFEEKGWEGIKIKLE